MERTLRTQRSLSKQDEADEAHEVVTYEDSKSLETKESTPSEEVSPPSNTLHRSRSQNKVKLLVRSHAVREETSPPPDPHQNTTEPGAVASPTKEQLPPIPNQVQQQSTTNRRHKLRREGSSSETWDHPPLSRAMLECELIQNPRSDEKDPLNATVSTACYSQPLINEYETEGNSREQYEGSSQVDLHKFIVDTLNRNYKDRMLLLKIESDLVALAKDPKRTMHKFAQMSSYQRMLVHRVAAYFNMEHNVDTSGVSVIVNTTKSTRIPETRFRDYVRDDLLLPEEPRRSILKRDSSSFEETGSFKSGERMLNGDSRRSKSFEEREEEYEKARRRIFNREHSGDGEIDCYGEQGDEDEDPWGFEVGFCCNSQCEHSKHKERNPPRLLKVESYESGDTLRENSLRLSVAKSHSFNGYDPPQQTRILTKQDSGSSMSSRISPSSSGYKSQRSDTTLSATPSPTATPNLHTQTGQPYTNADGSIYHYDPANPPRVSGDVAQPTIGQGANGVAPSQATAPLHKHGEWNVRYKKGRGAKGRGSKSRYYGHPQFYNYADFEYDQAYYIPQVLYDQVCVPQFVSAYSLAKAQQEANSIIYSVENSGTTYYYSSPTVPEPTIALDYYDWPPLEPFKQENFSTDYNTYQEHGTGIHVYEHYY